MVNIEQLYKDFGILADAKDKAGEHPEEYESILSGMKGGVGEKRLASQFVCRFFKYFPDHAEKTVDAIIDLSQDEDVAIRRQAIKDLPSLCKESDTYAAKVVNALVQAMSNDDVLSVIQSSLLAVFKLHPKSTLNGLFSQILEGDDQVREKAIKFLETKLHNLSDDIVTKEVEQFFVEGVGKVLQDVTGSEFVSLMKILSGLKSMKTLQGRQHLIDITIDQAELNRGFDPTDQDCVDRVVECINQALPYLSKGVSSARYFAYMCDHVLEDLERINEVDLRLDLLKLLAELSVYADDLEKTETHLECLLSTLMRYMPEPPVEGEENGENEKPQLQFTYIECLLFAIHKLASRRPQFFSDSQDRLKDFRLKLQFVAQGVQLYIKQLRIALKDKSSDAQSSPEFKIKTIALKTTNNIHMMIKDLFHNPPSFKSVIVLSWKSASSSDAVESRKRAAITPVNFDDKKIPKNSQAIYAPPEGKYSEKAGTFIRGRGRGNFRGRRQWRRGGRW